MSPNPIRDINPYVTYRVSRSQGAIYTSIYWYILYPVYQYLRYRRSLLLPDCVIQLGQPRAPACWSRAHPLSTPPPVHLLGIHPELRKELSKVCGEGGHTSRQMGRERRRGRLPISTRTVLPTNQCWSI